MAALRDDSMRRLVLVVVASVLAVAGCAALGAMWYNRPSVLKVAVTGDSEDFALLTAIAQTLSKEHEDLRLRIVPVNDAAASSAALEAEQADLAVVRSDVGMPTNGQTLVLLHRNAAILLAPPSQNISHISELKGRKVGVVRGPSTGAGNVRLFESLLAQYEISSHDVEIVELKSDEIFDAIASNRVSAVMTVGALTSQTVRDTVSTVTQAAGAPPVFIPVTEAKAMAQLSPVYESLEVVRGSFGGVPPKPSQPFETLAVSVRLVARSTLKDSVASDLTKLLFSDRPAIAQIAPMANQIETPSTTKGAAMPVHPGVAAWLDDDEKSFFDSYSDFIYIGAMVLSVLGSATAAVASRMTSGATQMDVEHLLLRLMDILRMARFADSSASLEELERETDEILSLALANRNSIDAQGFGAIGLALDQARRAVRDRRGTLVAHSNLMPIDGSRLLSRP